MPGRVPKMGVEGGIPAPEELGSQAKNANQGEGEGRGRGGVCCLRSKILWKVQIPIEPMGARPTPSRQSEYSLRSPFILCGIGP